jgi:hypothetical protein
MQRDGATKDVKKYEDRFVVTLRQHGQSPQVLVLKRVDGGLRDEEGLNYPMSFIEE